MCTVVVAASCSGVGEGLVVGANGSVALVATAADADATTAVVDLCAASVVGAAAAAAVVEATVAAAGTGKAHCRFWRVKRAHGLMAWLLPPQSAQWERLAKVGFPVVL